MKKRIISLLLTVLMVMSMISGLSVDAYAAQYNGANVIEYTMGQNDYVRTDSGTNCLSARICFCPQAIMTQF